MMSKYPDNETTLILKQAGFLQSEIDSAIKSYHEVIERFPGLIEPSNNSFFNFINSKFCNSAIKINRSIYGDQIWVPGNDEIKKLEEEGYWQEIIASILIEFLSKKDSWNGAISKFAIFRSHLRKKLPLHSIDAKCWYPCTVLISHITDQFRIEERHYRVFWNHFASLTYRNGVEGRNVPRYFYNYIKKNKDNIISKSVSI